jgi:CRISPR/Cas system-associated exonuclease Cas4 (RecB family)
MTFATLWDCHVVYASQSDQLCLRHTAAKFMPRLQTDYQRQHWLEVSMELQEHVRNDTDFLSNGVTVDEILIYGYSHEIKQQSSQKEAPICTPAEERVASDKQLEVSADLLF